MSVGESDAISMILVNHEWHKFYEEYEKQAISGIILHGHNKLPVEQRPPKELLLQWIGEGEIIRQHNHIMDDAVVLLCKKLDSLKCRYFIVKGQTLGLLYTYQSTRQCGDIDFIVHPSDWNKAFNFFKNTLGRGRIKSHSEKHIEWKDNGVLYEMHRKLNEFSSTKHQKYWNEEFMSEAWDHPYFIKINGYSIPTLAPLYNVLYVFVHLYYHLINEGVGLRQFVDWYYLLYKYELNGDYKEILRRHLNGIGLYNAFVGCGAVLTDYLSLDEDRFPFSICEQDHRDSRKMVNNILHKGNFGHSVKYVHPHGVVHGIQQFWLVLKQCVKFGYLAPSESWGYLLAKLRWWGKKYFKIAPSY